MDELPVADAEAVVRLAARNNAEWCDIFCRSHGVTGEFDADLWASARRTPPYYPDAVTLEVSATEGAVLSRVDASPGCSVKDSFLKLDLAGAGFRVLFHARWIYRDPDRSEPFRTGHLRWASVDDPSELGEWECAWAGTSESTALFAPPLLACDGLAFLAAYEGGRITAGAIASRSDGVIGLSNVFGPGHDPRSVWAGSVAMVGRLWPGIPIVGYESGPSLATAQEVGFASAGPLAIWVRRET
jgi:hypothetical protein